jgi:hypothetical protein
MDARASIVNERAPTCDGAGLQDIIAGLRASARTQTRALIGRLQRTTPRERVLLGVMVLGALVYAPIAAADWRVRQEDRYIDALSARTSARLAATSARRVEAAAADDQAVEDMKTWGFEASNVAVAQVRIEQQLARAASDAGLTNPSITTDSEVEAIGPTQWLGAEVQADLLWNPTFAFIDRIAGWPEGFRVVGFDYEITPLTQFQIQQQQQGGNGAPSPAPGGKIRIQLAFPVILPPGAADQDEDAA